MRLQDVKTFFYDCMKKIHEEENGEKIVSPDKFNYYKIYNNNKILEYIN